MTPERWQQVKAVYQEALGCDDAARAPFLDRACAGDAELRAEVDSMLEAYSSAGSFLDDRVSSSSRTLLMHCSKCGAHYDALHVVCPSDGEVLNEDPGALVGVTLDGLYAIEALIGRGGFGTVYRARHAVLGDRVAIKVLRRELSANPELVRRFVREGRAARQISHPNIVTVHDLRTSGDGLVYMVLEYVDGWTLRDELERRGPLSRDETLAILDKVVEALEAAHALGIVHRDLKPENIMLTGEDRAVKVLDLGLAKLCEVAGDARETATEITLPEQRMGSPRYMSPEQWGVPPTDGGPAIDARTDVYSLGVIAYEMLAGARPFEGRSTWDVRRAHLDEGPAVRDGIPPAIYRALERERSKRPSTPGEFLRELRENRAKPSSRVAVAVALAVVLAAVGAYFAFRPAVTEPPVAAQVPAARSWRSMSDSERNAFVDDRARAVSVAMAGRAYRIPPDVRLSILRAVDRYAARVGTGETKFGREDMLFVIARGRPIVSGFKQTFRDAGVPEFLGVYIPFVESEYHADAVSSFGARGMFQMMPRTAEVLGVSPDVLFDPQPSAAVAARYFHQQMTQFESDPMRVALAVAAYNLGPNDIQKYLNEVVVLDDAEAESRFWAAMGGSGFSTADDRETPKYVATFFAAAIVGENPEVFGIPGPALSSENLR